VFTASLTGIGERVSVEEDAVEACLGGAVTGRGGAGQHPAEFAPGQGSSGALASHPQDLRGEVLLVGELFDQDVPIRDEP
jgi:hypothetical protein